MTSRFHCAHRGRGVRRERGGLAIFPRTLLFVLGLGALPLPLHAQVRVGPEFQVNSYTTRNQMDSDVAFDAAGNVFVAWSSDHDLVSFDVFARWYEATGEPIGDAEFRVNATTGGGQRRPAVAAAPGGGVVLVWQSRQQDGSSDGIYARRYASPAAEPGPEFLVNGYTTGDQSVPDVAVDASGNFVVVWAGQGSGDGDGGIFGRRFDSSGSPLGSDFRVNTYTTSPQHFPAVASDAEGNFVVAWESVGPDGEDGIFAQRYDATGTAQGGEFRVSSPTTEQPGRPAIASDPEGHFVVVWTIEPNDDSDGDSDVWARRYDAAGVPKGDAFLVNPYTTGWQRGAAVASDAEGGFVVAWEGYRPAEGGFGVFGRRYDASGTPDPFDFRLQSYTTGSQSDPAVALDAEGDFVTTWSSSEQDGDRSGIFAQRFRSDLIFRDGFEDGTLGAWSLGATDGADLSVSPLAGLKLTGAGLLGVVDDTAGLYVQDDRPRDERRYRARFYFDPNGFDPGEAQSHRRIRIFLAFSEAPTRRVAAVVLRRLNGQYAIRARARLDDDRQAETAFIPITDGPHWIEFELRRSSFPFANNGQLTLTVDGITFVADSLDNDLANVDFVRMGALSVKTGANGTMYWDEFESRRMSPIGP